MCAQREELVCKGKFYTGEAVSGKTIYTLYKHLAAQSVLPGVLRCCKGQPLSLHFERSLQRPALLLRPRRLPFASSVAFASLARALGVNDVRV